MEVKTTYITKAQMDASYVKAECLLLATKGQYYYGEAFHKFIVIEEWEYNRILNNPISLLLLHRVEEALRVARRPAQRNNTHVFRSAWSNR